MSTSQTDGSYTRMPLAPRRCFDTRIVYSKTCVSFAHNAYRSPEVDDFADATESGSVHSPCQRLWSGVATTLARCGPDDSHHRR
jgi:hypothetical protein